MGEPVRLLTRVPEGSDGAYRLFIPLSLVLAIGLGFALGLHIAGGRVTGGANPTHTVEFIHAHGQVQILGFAGLYIMGMSLRLLPRFSGSQVAYPALLSGIAIVIAGSLVLRAIVQPFLTGEANHAAAIISAVGILAAATAYMAVVLSTAVVAKRSGDPAVLAFLAGSMFLVLSSILAAFMAVAQPDGAYFETQALLHLQLFGFVVSFLIGVILRAVPTMVGQARPSDGTVGMLVGVQTVTVLLVAAWLLVLAAGDADGMNEAASLAYALSGVVLVAISLASGALTSLRSRLRPASQPHLWLVRSAAFWLLIAGAMAIFFGIRALVEGEAPAMLELDAVRHTLGVGVITMLIVGMSLLIVPEFAAQRQRSNQSYLAAMMFAFLNLATVLRVLPSVGATWFGTSERSLMMGGAGILAQAAMIVFALSLFRLMRQGKE